MNKVRLLPTHLVNQIAAGEVVERPAAAIKELVENSLDAGATLIKVLMRGGGASELVVADDGIGMSRDDLAMAIKRHATSKLPDDDVFAAKTLGFRGEALAALGSVATMTIETRAMETQERGAEKAYGVIVDNGRVGKPYEVAREKGTLVRVCDLFAANASTFEISQVCCDRKRRYE